MAFPWAAAAGFVASAASAYLEHLRSRAESTQRAQDRRDIIAVVRSATDRLLTALVAATIAELRGELEGYSSTYDAYDADPDSPVEENRLVRLIDDSARTAGRLGVLADEVHDNPRLALESWPIYLAVIYLRAQAMTERQVTYGATELADALPSFDAAATRIEGLLAYLREQSDRRFGPIRGRIVENPPAIVTFYSFLGTPVVCGTPTAADPRKCERARARHMDSAYDDVDGVADFRNVLKQLRDVRDALDTFNVLDGMPPHVTDELGLRPGLITIADTARLEVNPG